jgi:hypothetical protein
MEKEDISIHCYKCLSELRIVEFHPAGEARVGYLILVEPCWCCSKSEEDNG